jgi:hypothetical protein
MKQELWRDKKVKQKHIEVGDSVLLQSPHTEASGKTGTQVDRTFHGDRKSKTQIFSFGRQ